MDNQKYIDMNCYTPEGLWNASRAAKVFGVCECSNITDQPVIQAIAQNLSGVSRGELEAAFMMIYDRLSKMEHFEQSSRKPLMYMVCGCSGSGKTTFAKKFAAENNLLYLGADEFYAKINGDELKRGNKFEVWQELFKVIHSAEISGVSCLVDTNSLSAASRDEMVNWFPGFDHHLIYIEADEQLRMENNRKRVRQIPDEIMIAMRTKVEPPVWNTLDKRWLSLTRILNDNNSYRIIQAEGGHKINLPA